MEDEVELVAGTETITIPKAVYDAMVSKLAEYDQKADDHRAYMKKYMEDHRAGLRRRA